MLSRKKLLQDLVGKNIDIERLPDTSCLMIKHNKKTSEYAILEVGEDVIKVIQHKNLTIYQYYAIDQIFLISIE